MATRKTTSEAADVRDRGFALADRPYDIWAVLQAADALLDASDDSDLKTKLTRIIRVASGMAYDLASEIDGEFAQRRSEQQEVAHG